MDETHLHAGKSRYRYLISTTITPRWRKNIVTATLADSLRPMRVRNAKKPSTPELFCENKTN